MLAVENCEAALRQMFEVCLKSGKQQAPVHGLSVGDQRPTREVLNYTIVISDPADRVPTFNVRDFKLPRAAGRFCWMMSASNRLADIEPYDRNVRRFSDDGLTLSGSDFGRRLRQPTPGTDQLTKIIRLLKEDPSTRRAVAAIYLPEDAARESRDIPCLIALAYHIRDGRLHATTIMRSNNAYRLAPYNLFELSLLGEVVAAELSVPFGSLTHTAVSLHLYEDEIPFAEEAYFSSKQPKLIASPKMPPNPLSGISSLVSWEASARTITADTDLRRVDDIRDHARQILEPYWMDLAMILLYENLCRAGKYDYATSVLALVNEYYRSYIEHQHQRSLGASH